MKKKILKIFKNSIHSNKSKIKIYDIKKLRKSKKFKKTFKSLSKILRYLNGFDDFIINELLLEKNDNDLLLSQIEFIYYTIIYFINNYTEYSHNIIYF